MATNTLIDICTKQTQNENTTQFHCRIPADFYGFEGHFENRPILPGVCQLRLVTEGIAHVEKTPDIARIERMKFHNLIVPDTTFILEIERHPTGWAFRICDGDKIFSSGKIILR